MWVSHTPFRKSIIDKERDKGSVLFWSICTDLGVKLVCRQDLKQQYPDTTPRQFVALHTGVPSVSGVRGGFHSASAQKFPWQGS